MWKYYLFRIVGSPLSLLPMWAGYIVAYIVADSVYALMPGLRRAVADNVRHVLGREADDAAVHRVVRGVIRNAARNYFDLIKMPRLELKEIAQRMTVHGWDHFEEALGRGKGVVLVSAHLGSFDLTGQDNDPCRGPGAAGIARPRYRSEGWQGPDVRAGQTGRVDGRGPGASARRDSGAHV
jgi:lauroyl/myristoyl acyltransferase